jgi:hypothetical protein
MHRILIFLSILIWAVIVASCIKPFDPDIRSSDANKYVVTGQVTAGDDLQTVNVSRTSLIGDPQYFPVTGCLVKILDDIGHEFPATETGNGDYSAWIDPLLLIPGVSFKVEITTPAGEQINSDFDLLTESPAMDSLYYLRKDIPGNNQGQITRGIQFYIDLNAAVTDSRYYRWEALETWEYHADYPLEWYYDGTVHHVSPPDYSRNVCWSTTKVPEIFTLTTGNLKENKYGKFPLHYVSNRTSRLMYGYSVLIKQYAISEAAYQYWDKLRINGSREGGLYTSQPLPIKGNMHSLTNPGDDVLGFFGAASLKTKRIFISNIQNLPMDFSTFCSKGEPERTLQVFGPDDYPVFLYGNAQGYTTIFLTNECVNCLSLGGTNVKPGFWPN